MDRGEFPHLTDAQFVSVRKMVGIFGGDSLRSLVDATPAEQVERLDTFDTYERGLIAQVQGLQAPVAEMKSDQPKPLRLKVNSYEGKEGENLHFWVREVELAMDAALISTERLRVAFALSNLGGRAKTWAYTREATSPGWFTTWAQGQGQVSVRPADGRVVSMDLAVKFEDFDSTESFLVLDMDKYDLILGMLWLEKHEPWIDWRGKAIGTSRPAVSDRELSLTPTKVLRRASQPAMRPMIIPMPDGTDQAGNLGPQAGKVVPQTAEVVEESAEDVSSVGNIVLRMVEESESKIESAVRISSVGNRVPRGVKKTNERAEVSLSTSRVDNQVPHSESETPPTRPVDEQYHVFDGVSGRQVMAGAVHLEALPEVSALVNLEELSMMDFMAELKAGDIAEMVLLKPDPSPEDLNSSSVMDEDVLEGFMK
ncbi:Gag protein [Phytophthora palmivora]|uniref:Gag protein n=1 Tax=Phytophthora palmivora TaxID=4796 RepID=A0A2P4X475_9STRA|nr:Gag protein [Phytophthora palmivora]